MEDEISFPFPDGFNRLAGKTDALNEAHIVARNSLLALLCTHEPWLQFVSDLPTEFPQDPDAVAEQGAIVARRIADFAKTQLRLPYAWAALDLFEIFYAALVTAARGEKTFTRALQIEPLSLPAPEIRLDFFSEQGRPALDALADMDAHIAEAVAIRDSLKNLIVEPARSRGRPPKETEKYVRWYFQRHIKGEPMPQIAEKEGCDPSDIREGIRRARGLLGIADQFWDDIEDDDPAIVNATKFWANDKGGEGNK